MSIKNNLKHHINHQTQTDLVGEWFNFDKKFKAKRFASFINYKVSFARQTSSNLLSYTFNSFQINLLKFSNFMSKNIITILATILLVLGLGGATAQAFAPEDLKPLTIIRKTFNPKDFASNTVVEKNPYTELRPDAQNDVIFSDTCDLAIKYPKRYENKFDTAIYSGFRTSSELGSDYINILPRDGELESGDEYMGPTISCSNQTPNGLDPDPIYAGVVDTATYGKEIKNAGIDFIKKETGWFLTQAEIEGVRVYDNPYIPGDYKVYFKFKNLHYLIGFQTNDLKNVEGDSDGLVKVIKASAVQIQFKSLVESEDNAKVIERSQSPIIPTPQNDKDNTKPPVANPNPVDSKQIIKVEPKDPSLVKRVNPKNGISKSVHDDIQTCGVEGVVQYNTSDYVSGNMRISSTGLNLNSSELESYNRLKDFLDGKIEFKPDFAKNIQYINQFIDSCGVIYNHKQLIEAPKISYPGTDKVKIVYALTGQALYMDPIVQVYAQKGDNQIWLESTVSMDKYDSLAVAQSCGWKTGNYGEVGDFDQKCYENKLKQDPKLKLVLDQMAQDLIKTFELK